MKIILSIHIWLLDIDVDMDHSYEETRLNISTDDTLVEDGFNNCDIPQEIQESENESGCEEFPSKWLNLNLQEKNIDIHFCLHHYCCSHILKFI